MKICTLCKEEKPLSEFKAGNSSDTWIRARCHSCSELGKNLFHTGDGRKLCRKCSSFKQLDEFGRDKNKADKLRTYCKECNSNEYKKWYYKDSEKSKQVSKEWRDRNPDKRKAMWEKYFITDKKLKMFKTYGLTFGEYEKMLQDQEFKCKTCLIHFSTIPAKQVHIDHCHKSGKVRGILCHRCNISLGTIKENIQTLKNMIIYLEEHNERMG
jgi:hypothetical protein